MLRMYSWDVDIVHYEIDQGHTDIHENVSGVPAFLLKIRDIFAYMHASDNYTSEIMADPFCVFLALYNIV